MLNPGLPEILWSRLDGRLWHATERDSLSGIISAGEIRVGIRDRYLSSFCRCHGGVSPLDFGPTAVDVSGKFDQWTGWFGYQQECSIAIWLEIDRARVLANLWDAGAARKKWNEPPYGEFIHGVEACHVGPIPIAAIVSTALIARDDREMFQQCDGLHPDIFQQIVAFELKLPAPRQNSTVEILLSGRQRSAEKAESANVAVTRSDQGKK